MDPRADSVGGPSRGAQSARAAARPSSRFVRRALAALLIAGQLLAPSAALAQMQRSTAPSPPVVDPKAPPPLAPARVQSDKRLALVIGNNAYKNAPLVNPINDARLVASTLKTLGFEVMLQENVNLRDFKAVMRRFVTRMEAEDGSALFYYAGHGVQIEGRNYLLPVDVGTGDEYEVRDESVDLEETLMSRLAKTRKRERIIILDACRDNPFKAAKGNRGIGNRGLAQMGSDDKGTLIVYSTSPGHTAEDGTGKNSVFTEHFANEIQKEGVEVGLALRSVFNQVDQATKGRQTPWYNSSLSGGFYFKPVDPRIEEERRRKEIQAQVEAAVKAAKDDAKRDEAARIEAMITAKERERQEREKQYAAQIAEMKAMLERRDRDLDAARVQMASAAKTRDEQLAALAAAEAERKRIERETTITQASLSQQQQREAAAADQARKAADAERFAREKRERDAATAAISAERTKLLKLEADLRASEEKAAREEAERQAKAAAEIARRDAEAKAAQDKAARDQRALAEAQRKAAERDRLAQAEATRRVAAEAKREDAARLAKANTEKLRALEDRTKANAARERETAELARQRDQAAAQPSLAAARAADEKLKRAKEDAERAQREAEAQARLAKIEEDVRRKAAQELELLNRQASLPPELAALMVSTPEKVVVSGSQDFVVRGVRLPADIAVKPAAPNVPASCASFVGAWGNGRWNGERTAEIWVEAMEADCRGRAIYARGGTGMSGDAPTYVRGEARVSGDKLTLDLPNGVKIELARDGDRAEGRWSSGVNTATAQFTRIPAEPDRAVTLFANESVDYGGKPSRVISASQIDTNNRSQVQTMLPLPVAVPGVDTLTTLQLDAFLKKNPGTILVDATNGGQHRTLPGALWMPDLGQVRVGQKELSQIESVLAAANGGDLSRPIVVFERSSTYGWLGYHGVLRLLGMGYTNIYWYRGGVDAWHDAQLTLAQADAWSPAR